MGAMSKACLPLAVCALALLAPASLRAEPAVLGLARSYLGPESTLEGITSIHFVGTLDRVDPDHPKEANTHATLDMVFEKPLRQRLEIHGTKVSRTTVLDGYDAWDVLRSNADPAKVHLNFLPPAEIKTLRANTWENLYFFRVPPWGSEEDKGPATVDGIECERVDFVHDAGTTYARYFDRDTGRLVLTMRGPETLRQVGEIVVDGIRFPKSVVSTAKTPSGAEVVSTVAFQSITLNELVPAGLFAAPSYSVPSASPAATPGK
jgi:hypothetical protein